MRSARRWLLLAVQFGTARGLAVGSAHADMGLLGCLRLENAALNVLRVDPSPGGLPRMVRGAHIVRVMPTPLENPVLVAACADTLRLIGVAGGERDDDADALDQAADELARSLSGNELLQGAEPTAACYCGYQFGVFAGQLGDGAAITLGEVKGADGKLWQLQLKGAGPTPFSRMADGRKALRAAVREFLASEAMHALGVPTTRAAAIVSSESRIMRGEGGDGKQRAEHCGVVTRVARSFLRFGSFEVCHATNSTDQREGPSVGLDEEMLTPLLDHALERLYPETAADLPTREARAAAFLRAVVERTARLAAKWQAVGFVHGVLNTDNMAISGDTIDYGPFGFVNAYDPDYSPNAADAGGRYSYREQPRICFWNLERLAEALEPLLPPGGAKDALRGYWPTFERAQRAAFREKLGLLVVEHDDDNALLASFLDTLERSGADFTNCFRALSRVDVPASAAECVRPPQAFDPVLDYLLSQCASAENLLKRLRPVFHPSALARLQQLDAKQLGSFGLSQAVIQRETRRAARREALTSVPPATKRLGDAESWREWLRRYRLRLLLERQATMAEVAELDPTGETADSLAAAEAAAAERAVAEAAARRVAVMNRANPAFVLRQHLAARAVERAEVGDFSEVRSLLELLQRPYDDQGFAAVERYGTIPPDWSHSVEVV